MESLQPVAKADVTGLEVRADEAIRRGDAEALGALIAEVEQRQAAFLRQVAEEERLASERARDLATAKKQLPYLPESEARARHRDLMFLSDAHAERAAACMQQAEMLGKLLADLRKRGEALQAKALQTQLARQAVRLRAELAEAKAAVQPLLAVIEKAFAVVRQIEQFNMTSRAAKIPVPTLTGDVGAVNKLGQINFLLPPEWQQQGERRREAGTLLTDAELLAAHGFGD